MLVKKYGNRRLYDTDQSRYITLEQLAESVRQGKDVRVVDARTGDDLTTATLAQIIVEESLGFSQSVVAAAQPAEVHAFDSASARL